MGSKTKGREKMTKAKNIEYKNGMKFSCGPPRVSGGYEKWNWCKKCDAIYDKSHKMCKDCKQCLRQSARSNNNWYTADGTKRTKGDTR